jgi:SAM-dependent methyltransferase
MNISRFFKSWLRPATGPSSQEPFDWRSYWEDRARRFGVRAVYDLGHREEELAAVTVQQEQFLFPLLKRELNGSERQGLDFGCGPGRFSPGLAAAFGGHVWAVDPIESFINKTKANDRVTYQTFDGQTLPFEKEFFDVVWVCLVLGGLNEHLLPQAASELTRVLKPGGLLFLVEDSTSGKAEARHWHARSVAVYQAVFPEIALREVGHYYDLGERISVMAGRKALVAAGHPSV